MVTHWPVCYVYSGGVWVFGRPLQHQNSLSCTLCAPPQAKTFPMNSANLELVVERDTGTTPPSPAWLPLCPDWNAPQEEPNHQLLPMSAFHHPIFSAHLTLTKPFATAKYPLPVPNLTFPRGAEMVKCP